MVRTLRAELGAGHGTLHRGARELEYGTEPVRPWVRQADIVFTLKPNRQLTYVSRQRSITPP